MSQESKDLAKKFIKFLNEKYPLKNDILVSFFGGTYRSNDDW